MQFFKYFWNIVIFVDFYQIYVGSRILVLLKLLLIVVIYILFHLVTNVLYFMVLNYLFVLDSEHVVEFLDVHTVPTIKTVLFSDKTAFICIEIVGLHLLPHLLKVISFAVRMVGFLTVSDRRSEQKYQSILNIYFEIQTDPLYLYFFITDLVNMLDNIRSPFFQLVRKNIPIYRFTYYILQIVIFKSSYSFELLNLHIIQIVLVLDLLINTELRTPDHFDHMVVFFFWFHEFLKHSCPASCELRFTKVDELFFIQVLEIVLFGAYQIVLYFLFFLDH